VSNRKNPPLDASEVRAQNRQPARFLLVRPRNSAALQLLARSVLSIFQHNDNRIAEMRYKSDKE